VAAGSGAGQFALLPVMALLMEQFGWRRAFLALGAGVLVIAVPTVLLLLRDDPEGAAERRGGPTPDGERPLPVLDIARHANFWWLALSFFVCGVTTAGLIDTHLIPYAQDHHIAPVTAATAFGVLSLVNTVFTMASGAVGDRWGFRWLLGWIYAGRAVTLVFLIFARDPGLLFVFAVAFGIVDFSTVAPTTALSTQLFGRRSAGTVFGLVALSHQIGSAAGSYAGGVVHDWTGSYVPFFMAAAALSGTAALMAWAIAEDRVVAQPEASPA
jgi:predicted MFS family arabinose efflux permease